MSCLWKDFPLATSFEPTHKVPFGHQALPVQLLWKRIQRYIWFEKTHSNTYRFVSLFVSMCPQYCNTWKLYPSIYVWLIFMSDLHFSFLCFQVCDHTNAPIATKLSPSAVHWRVTARKFTVSRLSTHTKKGATRCTCAKIADTLWTTPKHITSTSETTIRIVPLSWNATTRGSLNSTMTKYHKQWQQVLRRRHEPELELQLHW